MTLLPEILVGLAVAWVFASIMCAYYYGKMKGAEPKIIEYEAEGELGEEVYPGLLDDGNTYNTPSA